MARSEEFGLRPQQGWFSAWLAGTYLALGDVDRARELAALAIEIGRQVAFPYGAALAMRAAGRVALASGDHATARLVLQQALERFRSIPARTEIVQTERDMRRLAGSRGETAPV